jgi:hypothetical protein
VVRADEDLERGVELVQEDRDESRRPHRDKHRQNLFFTFTSNTRPSGLPFV